MPDILIVAARCGARSGSAAFKDPGSTVKAFIRILRRPFPAERSEAASARICPPRPLRPYLLMAFA
jgi:hypothetical protein